MLLIAVTVLHVLVSFFLIIVVLLQSGKAGDIAAAFGGMGSQTAFGPRGGATLLTKATTAAAVLFILTSITLTILATRQTGAPGSVLEGSQPAATEEVPPQQQQPLEGQPPANPPQ